MQRSMPQAPVGAGSQVPAVLPPPEQDPSPLPNGGQSASAVSQLNKSLCCPVSQDPYAHSGPRRPRILPCGHSVSHVSLAAVRFLLLWKQHATFIRTCSHRFLAHLIKPPRPEYDIQTTIPSFHTGHLSYRFKSPYASANSATSCMFVTNVIGLGTFIFAVCWNS